MDDDVVSWRAVPAHCPILTSEGEEIGKVVDVAALDQEDIFHGIVFKHEARGTHLLAPAADVATITRTAVHLGVGKGVTDEYEEFHSLHVERLGLTGLFRWKHTGWKDSSE